MAIRPNPGSNTVLKGLFAFEAFKEGLQEISDSYDLSILVPETFPRDLPRVTETAGRIPRDGKHHINADGTLCLGAPLRLLWNFSKIPSLVGFAEIFLVPFLYAMSLKLNYGIPFVFGELAHGASGELADYVDMLGLKSPEQAKRALALLAQKKGARTNIHVLVGVDCGWAGAVSITRFGHFVRLPADHCLSQL